jgi:hypothetical protein
VWILVAVAVVVIVVVVAVIVLRVDRKFDAVCGPASWRARSAITARWPVSWVSARAMRMISAVRIYLT